MPLRGFAKVASSIAKGAASALSKVFGTSRAVPKTVIKWFDKQRISELDQEMRRRMEIVMALLERDLKQAVSVPVGRDSFGRVTERSVPGEFPRLETGALKASIDSKVVRDGKNSWAGLIWAKKPYGYILEKKMDRLFLKAIYYKNLHKIKRELTRPNALRSGRALSITVTG